MGDSAKPIEWIFSEALLRPDPVRREAFLNDACGDDAVLRRRLDALLRAHDAAGDFLGPASGVSDDADPSAVGTLNADAAPDDGAVQSGAAGPARPHRAAAETAGSVIGHYKLLQRIGEGGFGVVWMADQEKPVRRRVALKVIKAGMDSKRVVARFEQERQALAMMDHPNIARVLDGGTTQTGRPYFVMELVRGVKITEYCDTQGLSTVERIELFITVCHAVQHAHQKGIIHRDLKPSNILVTVNDGEAVPKVIDFGVAKATQGRLTDGTLFTQFEQMIGTPLYMSPEQAELTSLDVDTRSDVYALGVLLYELLTGRTPIDTATMARAGMDEVRRLIREVDPPRPSARLRTLAGEELTTVAKRRHTDAAKLPGALRGDIDWIVMKCLEKDRKRRYDTANGLASDLRRHLHNDVVMARPPTTAYLLSKLVRRNKLAFAAGAAVAVSLIVGIAASVGQAVRATRAEGRALATLDELRATAPAFAEQARGLAARERFAEAVEKLDYALKLRPDAAEFLVAKADLLQCQLKLSEAAAVYRDALRADPRVPRAAASAKLCDELLAAPPGKDGKLSRESLARLHVEMQQQQRPAAELMPVARLLGEEKTLLVAYWLDRLKDLPVSAETPLAKRLTVREDGRLALDLSDTKVVDLSPLAGAPIASLNVSRCKELTDLSPLRKLDLVELNASETGVEDLTPLRDARALKTLDVSGSRVTDLSALAALRPTTLNFSRCPVRDLSPIRNMPLEEMNLRETRVADLSPLVGMPIKTLDLSGAPVLDFSPLARLPLEKCYLQRNRITDLSVLRGRPLKELVLWGCVDARNYAALAEIQTLELLLLPSEYRGLPSEEYAAIASLRKLPRLRQLGSEIMNQMGYAATGGTDVFWQDWDREQAFVPALRKSGLTFSLSKFPTGSYYLGIFNQPLRDLSIIKGAPISYLHVSGCPISDLTPLRELPLDTLRVNSEVLSDLGPLRGMPLKTLYLAGPRVRDLSPLAGVPLKELLVGDCPGVADVAALAEMATLEHVTVPKKANGVESLRKLPRLQRLAFQHTAPWIPISTADEFWKDWVWIARMREAGLAPQNLNRLEDGTWAVDLRGSGVTDLAPLRGTPISELELGNTGVSDLTPLTGLSLRHLHLYNTKVTDLGPLRGMALERLSITGTAVADLSALRGMPLLDARLHRCTNLTDVSALGEAKGLTTLTLPEKAKSIDFLREFPRLAHVGFQEANGLPDRTAAEFWNEQGTGWVRALRDGGIAIKSIRRQPDGTWELNLGDSTLGDLTILKGAPISSLVVGNTPISSVEPLRGMPLRKLWINDTRVTDLSPLRGMKLEVLHVGGNGKPDLTAIRGMPLTELRINDCLELTDLSPLRGLPVATLRLHNCPLVIDLSPLADAKDLTDITLPPNATDIEFLRKLPRLERISQREDSKNGYRPDKTADEFWKEWDGQGWLRALRNAVPEVGRATRVADGTWELGLRASTITDLAVLKGAPLSSLDLGQTVVSDLTPLTGMSSLKDLRIYWTKVTDLGPLKGMPLRQLHMNGTDVTDLSALRGMPLTHLKLNNCTALTDLSPLVDCRELVNLTLPPTAEDIAFLRGLPKLERISFSEDPRAGYRPDKTAAQFWSEIDERARIDRALRDAGFTVRSLTRFDDGTWEVNLSGMKLGDLKALRTLPVSALQLGDTGVADLEPLRGMPLKKLYLYDCPVTDLTPLEGMQLEWVSISGTSVTDVSVLRGMPLNMLRLHACRDLTDLSPLAKCKGLVTITVPPNPKDIGFLRGFPNLTHIGFTEDPKAGYRPDRTAAAFWKEYDAKNTPN